MRKRTWLLLGVLLAVLVVSGWAVSRLLLANPTMTFLVVIEGKAEDGQGWLAYRYQSKEPCYIEGGLNEDLKAGQVVDVTGQLRGTRDGRRVVTAFKVNLDVPQYFPTEPDVDDTGLPGLSDPSIPIRPPSSSDRWTTISGTVEGVYRDDPDRYLFHADDGEMWVLWFPRPHKDFRRGDAFTVIGEGTASIDGYPTVTVETLEAPEVHEYGGPFPGDLIQQVEVVEAQLPTEVVLAVRGTPPLKHFHISYGFTVDLGGKEYQVYPCDVTYELRADGVQLVHIYVEPGHDDLATGRWTLRIWPTDQLVDGLRVVVRN